MGPEEPTVRILKHAVLGVILSPAQLKMMSQAASNPPATKGWLGPADMSGYRARPLNGVWSSAPYLHNGSVPTLFDLLQDQEKRPKQFRTGSRVFDPVKVGFAANGLFQFDTTLPGSSNQGHNFTADLTDEQRYDLIEYLKKIGEK